MIVRIGIIAHEQLERLPSRGAAPEASHQTGPPVPPSFPPPTLPLPPPPLERRQGSGAAPVAPHQAFWPRGPPPYPPPLPPPLLPPPAGPPPYGPARSNLGDPGPPRRRLEYPGGGAGGGEVPQCDNGSAGGPGGRGRRAPGGAWGQLSERVRDELARPLRVESGRTDEPRTIERPRGRARVLDRRELAPLPGGGAAWRSNAAALARGVGHGITVGDGDRIGQRRRDGGARGRG